ncbi:MAG: hypothetical protein NTY86_13225 [Deltaproteobacteria bacterium]|nr:hypothetical protein [Deltaproteobacteria bacterium]
MELKATVSMKGAIFDGKAPEIIRKDLLSAMYEATRMLERKVKLKTPKGVFGSEAGLYKTIYGEVVQHGTAVVGNVGHGMKYGDVIEYGRSPGKKPPPIAPLQRWIEFKGITITDKKTGKALSSRTIAFMFSRSIGKKGFPGVHMFENAFVENQGKLTEIFDRAGFDIAFHLSEDKS